MTDEQQERHEERMRRTAELRAWAQGRGRGAVTLLQKRTGLTFAAVSRLVKGQAAPSPRSAVLLERATDGAVSAASLLGLPPGRAA